MSLILRESDFYVDAHQVLYSRMLQMHNAGRRLDELLLVEELNRNSELETIGGIAYLAEIAQAAPHAAHATHYSKVVADHAVVRALIQTSTEVLRDAYNPDFEPRELVSQAEERVFAIQDQRGGTAASTIEEVLFEVFDRIDARKDHDRRIGVRSGFVDLDDMTDGMQNSELVILAARPSMGKTALATNIVEHVVLTEQIPTLFVSLEMSAVELGERMLCSRAKVDSLQVRKGLINPTQHDKLVEESNALSQAPLFVDDTPGRTMTEIAATGRRLKRADNLGLIVIDYLQLIEPDNARDPRQEQVAKIARRLKGLARELKIPVLCLAQLNRQTEASRDNRPKLSQLRESGAIEQDADVVMFVHREEYYHSPEEVEQLDIGGQADLIIAKQRNGPTGEVKLSWKPEYTRFSSRSMAQEPLPYDFDDQF